MLLRTSVLLVAALWASVSAQAPDAPASPPPAIRVEGGCEVAWDQGVTAFLLTIQNVGAADTAVTLGLALGNGAEYHAANVSLRLEGASGTDEFHFGPVRVAGRVDPFFVPLPAGARYMVRLAPNRMISQRSRRLPEVGYLSGTQKARLTLDARPISFINDPADSLALMRVTIGRFESEPFTVPDDCTRVGGKPPAA